MPTSSTVAIHALIGFFVLFFGRKLFWLFVGAVGFMLAMTLAKPLLIGQPEWVVLTVGLAAGIVGALCALAVERVAVMIAGLVAGGTIAMRLLEVTNFERGPLSWFLILVGAVVGALVIALLFDPALIVLSSLVGASLVSECVPLRPSPRALLFTALLVAGVVVQARLLRRRARLRL